MQVENSHKLAYKALFEEITAQPGISR